MEVDRPVDIYVLFMPALCKPALIYPNFTRVLLYPSHCFCSQEFSSWKVTS